MKIFLTGDTHGVEGLQKRIGKDMFPQQETLNQDEENYLIVLGDIGLVWDEDYQKQIDYISKNLNGRNFSLLFVAGNHENYDLLKGFPESELHGGAVSILAHNIYWLHTGEVFNFDGNHIAIYGGATSIDKIYRTEGKTWWKDEVPSVDYEHKFVRKLEDDFNWKVDYLLTHTTSNTVINQMGYYEKLDPVSSFLNFIQKYLDYKCHYFGHFHTDDIISDKEICLYKSTVEPILDN